MSIIRLNRASFRLAMVAGLLLGSTACALATPTDEIQVYTSDIEPTGVFGSLGTTIIPPTAPKLRTSRAH